MNWKRKHKENTLLIRNYNAYLKIEVVFKRRIDLCTEIGRLHTQNKMIDQMTVADYAQDTHDYDLKITQE